MIDEDQELQWTFYHLYDESKRCYLVGSMLSGNGNRVTPEDHPLNTGGVTLQIKTSSDFFAGVPFVWHNTGRQYITEQTVEVPIGVVGSNPTADLVVSNALIARKSLDDLFKEPRL